MGYWGPEQREIASLSLRLKIYHVPCLVSVLQPSIGRETWTQNRVSTRMDDFDNITSFANVALEHLSPVI